MIQPVFLFYIDCIFNSLQPYWIVTNKNGWENGNRKQKVDRKYRCPKQMTLYAA